MGSIFSFIRRECFRGTKQHTRRVLKLASCLLVCLMIAGGLAFSGQHQTEQVYVNRLTPIHDPRPILADHPEYIEPIRETTRFEAPPIIDEKDGDLRVRSWRFSYNAQGIIEVENRLKADETALIMVHPWGIDDGQGWKTPEPAGVADFCTPEKNHLVERHERDIVNPLIKSLRGKVKLVMFSLPANEDSIRKKLYRSFNGGPTAAERTEGAKELSDKLNSFSYRGEPLPSELKLSQQAPLVDYFRLFPGLDAGTKYDPAGFWELPIPVVKDIGVDPDDVIIYDAQGYQLLKEFLQRQGIRHVLLIGYATDMCYRKTTAGYENLSANFNVFLVGDATLATFPSNSSPRFATNAAISYAAIDHMITQISWINYKPRNAGKQ
ncbi:MAG TPA: isochorismatase family protein [Candidatus Dormibacteraeota bacterium]|nr:isochorismatase family protein [Candidatus Dormibacteraeota bacterium]